MTTTDSQGTLLDAANQLLKAGRAVEAIGAHERLLARYPQLPDSWFNLAYLQQCTRRYDAALVSYERAIERGLTGAEEAHLNRAVIFADHLARPVQAERELRSALVLNHAYVPAWLNLGNLHEHNGDRLLALQAYERVLAIDPANSLALARLPNLKAIGGIDDPLIARLRRAVLKPGATASERADLCFGLGKALDDVAAYDEAFAAYTSANQASRESAGASGRYDALAHERLVDRLIRAFPAAERRVARDAAARPPPLFICGMFRSGSTLVEQILASHPRVTAGGEIDLLPTLAREHLLPRLESLAPVDDGLLQRFRATYLDGIAALFPEADLVTDKRPDNFLYIGLIKALFPDARIVHTRRDPVDNCLSVFFLHLGHSMPYALDLLDTAHWYRQYQRLMAHWKSLYGDAIFDLDYDVLVTDPRRVIEETLDYCRLEWDDACLAFHNTRVVVKTPSAWQVRQPLYTRSSGRWRHYEGHLAALRSALAGAPP